MPGKYPSFNDPRTKRSFEVFEKLHVVHRPPQQPPRKEKFSHSTRKRGSIDAELANLDEEKMMAHILDCVAALAEKQRARVALNEPLTLKKDKDAQALTAAQQAVRNKVFRAALGLLAEGLTHDGDTVVDDECSKAVRQLAMAFPDDDKLKDGRGWLPLHWAVAAAGEQWGVTTADVEVMYSVDPLALYRHHSENAGKRDLMEGGFTPAHLLCMQEMTERTQALVRFCSTAGPQSFTMDVSFFMFDGDDFEGDAFGALHVACVFGQPTEWLVQRLLQLDDTACQTRVVDDCTPLGLMCKYATGRVDESAIRCLLAADSSVEVVYDGIRGCLESKVLTNRVEAVTLLLEANPQAAQHDHEGLTLAYKATYNSDTMSAQDCIDVLKLLLAANKDAFKAVNGAGGSVCLPVQWLARWGPFEALEYLLDACPEMPATAVSTELKKNLLHYVAQASSEDQVAKARLLCSRYPAMMLQRDYEGHTPLHVAIYYQTTYAVLALCKAGGREVASAPVVHPTSPDDDRNGWLPIHFMMYFFDSLREASPLSLEADAFRMLLRLYPEAAGIEAGTGSSKKTPYQLAVDEDFPAYYRRLLLRAAPHSDPAELHRLNWEARQQAMFLGFRALGATPPLLARLRYENKDLVKHVVSFL